MSTFVLTTDNMVAATIDDLKRSDGNRVHKDQLITVFGSLHLQGSFATGEIPFTISHVSKTFKCYTAGLKTLKGCPETVGGGFVVYHNKLTSLEYAPKKVHGNFNVSTNKVQSFDHCPEYILNNFFLANNAIESVCGLHTKLLHCQGIDFSHNYIQEGGIGLLLIEGLEKITANATGSFERAANIINGYLGKGKSGLLECQQELLDKGLDRFAKL